MSNFVFVLDTHKRALDPCHPAVARKLLNAGKAAVFRRFPFTIILKRPVDAPTQPIELKIDPGSKVTGIALVQNGRVIWAAEVHHRGALIRKKLDDRRARRRRRRSRLRYRKPRFLNRRRPEGWLAPSLQHRVETVSTWVDRLRRYAPVESLAQELVRFDTQAIQNPEISGVEYQQGELFGYEVREYLLEKWGRKCAYCDKTDVPLEIEHIHPRSNGGSHRVSNLTLACQTCNQRKGNRDVREFLKGKPERLNKIQALAKAPLKDAAAVNTTRWALFQSLKMTGLSIVTGTGGRTKFNRRRLDLPKEHWLDAACVGDVTTLQLATQQPLSILCKGQGTRQKAALNQYGYPIRHNACRPVHGWRTGDIVKVNTALYRITPRTTGSFGLTALNGGALKSKPRRHLHRVYQFDGYNYSPTKGSICEQKAN